MRYERMRARRALGVAVVVPVLMLAGCGGDDDSGTASEDTTAEEGSSSEESEEPPTMEPVEEPEPVDVPPGHQAMLDDAQAVCDALDHDEVAGIIGAFNATRTDDAGPNYSLCSFAGEDGEIARVWLYESWDDRVGLRRIDNDEFTECQVGDYEAMCQSNQGAPDMPNGWPKAATPLGALSVEAQTPDPAMAQALLAAVMDDLEAAQ